MTTVICPECHRPATVLARFTQAVPGRPAVDYLRIRCGLLPVLVTADEVAEARRAVPPRPGLAAA